MTITKAFFNMDYNSVDIEYSDDSRLRILCELAEKNLDTTIESESKLIWLAENEPLTYAELILDGTMQEYLDIIKRQYTEQANTIYRQCRQRHPDMSDSQIRSMIREFQMYDS